MSSPSDIQHQLDEAIANANAHPLDDDAQQKVLDMLVNTLGDADANAKLITEIQALGGYSLEIRTAMDHIDDIFRSIQLGNTSDGLKKDVQGLQDKWTGYCTTYTTLLWDSRRVAGDAESAANDFAGDFIKFLSDEATSIDTKKTEIANYLTQLASDEPKAAAMSQGFTDLQLNVTNFQQDWATVVAKYSLDDLNAQATQLQSDIDDLTATLAGLADKIHQLTIALGVTAATAGVTGILGFICPAFWIGTVVSIVGLIVEGAMLKQTQDLYDATESDLNDKKNQLKTVVADIAAVKELKAGLENSKADFDTITTRLGAFASVWATLRADIQAIEKKLELAHSTGIWSLMHSRLNGAAALYVSLGKALRQYQVSVNPDALNVAAPA